MSPAIPLKQEKKGSMTHIASGQTFRNEHKKVLLELRDGRVFEGLSFGAEKSASGELVFQTGMVGYPESVTDPSYQGQILVITFPLVGNYGVPSRETLDELLDEFPRHFESNRIHVAGLVVASYAGEQFSHHLATSSLGTWLKEQGIPAMHGVDTRALTKIIREEGSMLGRMMLQSESVLSTATNGTKHLATNGHKAEAEDDWRSQAEPIDWHDQNQENLVAQVSVKAPRVVAPPKEKALQHPSGRPVRVLVVDVGLKYNQLRCLLSRGVEVKVVPWDYDFPALAGRGLRRAVHFQRAWRSSDALKDCQSYLGRHEGREDAHIRNMPGPSAFGSCRWSQHIEDEVRQPWTQHPMHKSCVWKVLHYIPESRVCRRLDDTASRVGRALYKRQ